MGNAHNVHKDYNGTRASFVGGTSFDDGSSFLGGVSESGRSVGGATSGIEAPDSSVMSEARMRAEKEFLASLAVYNP